MKKVLSFIISMVLLVNTTSSAFAHVVVNPGEAETASHQTFAIGVPNHREIPTTGVRVVIPEGITDVSPNVKPGWKITIVREDQHVMSDGTVMDNAAHEEGNHDSHGGGQVKEIIWSGGSIPEGQRDDFYFSAKTPEGESTISWQAYQTYSDGQVVSWDLLPGEEYPKTEDGEDDVFNYGPASETKIISAEGAKTDSDTLISGANNNSDKAMILSFAAFALSAGAIGMQFIKKKK